MGIANNRLLVVDDEPAIVEAYVEFLAPRESGTAKRSSRSQGASPEAAAVRYEVLAATSGEEALALFKKEFEAGRRISGGFFDVKMGGMDGLTTIQEIWKIDPQMHCTIVTAYQDRSVDDIDKLFHSSFKDQWDYLNKPFTHYEIIQKARQMIAAWNRMRSLELAMDQLKKTQNQLIQSERYAAIGQVARAVGHEFGNVLQAILGKADLALQDESLERVQEKLKTILQAAERASLIVRNLKSFSQNTNVREKVRWQSILQDTLSLVNHVLVKNSIQIVDARQPCAEVHACSAELEQVVLNLMINAVHAMPKNGKLEIGCSDRDNEVIAWVQDTGTGIAPEVLPRIFEYAFTTKGTEGSGLGLSISKQIVQQHGGKIEVETEVGKGTKFIIVLQKAK